MRNDLFDTALKNGDYISINEFLPEIGEDCGCICPKCGEPVRSNVTGKLPEELKASYTNHFSHIDESSTCFGGYAETTLHIFAKEILSKNRSLKVPGEKYHYPETLNYRTVVLEKSFPVEKFKQYRPDLIITDLTGEKIAVEIVVTNPVSIIKKEMYKESRFKSLVVNLSVYERSNMDEIKEKVSDDILNNAKIKEWIWPVIIQDIYLLTDGKKNKSSSTSFEDNGGCMLTLAGILLLIFILM